MASQIVSTSEVNLVDLYITRKIDTKTLFYKLICGAIVTVVAFRVNDMTKDLSTFISMKAYSYVEDEKENILKKLGIELAVLAAMFQSFVILNRAF